MVVDENSVLAIIRGDEAGLTIKVLGHPEQSAAAADYPRVSGMLENNAAVLKHDFFSRESATPYNLDEFSNKIVDSGDRFLTSYQAAHGQFHDTSPFLTATSYPIHRMEHKYRNTKYKDQPYNMIVRKSPFYWPYQGTTYSERTPANRDIEAFEHSLRKYDYAPLSFSKSAEFERKLRNNKKRKPVIKKKSRHAKITSSRKDTLKVTRTSLKSRDVATVSKPRHGYSPPPLTNNDLMYDYLKADNPYISRRLAFFDLNCPLIMSEARLSGRMSGCGPFKLAMCRKLLERYQRHLQFCPKSEVELAIHKYIDKWQREIPVYPDETKEQRHIRKQMINKLREDLISIPNEDTFLDKASQHINECLDTLPMWLPQESDTNFKEQIARSLLNKLDDQILKTSHVDVEIFTNIMPRTQDRSTCNCSHDKPLLDTANTVDLIAPDSTAGIRVDAIDGGIESKKISPEPSTQKDEGSLTRSADVISEIKVIDQSNNKTEVQDQDLDRENVMPSGADKTLSPESSIPDHEKNIFDSISVSEQRDNSVGSRRNSRQISESLSRENEKRISEYIESNTRTSVNGKLNGSNNTSNMKRMSKSAVRHKTLSESKDHNERVSIASDHQRDISNRDNGRQMSELQIRDHEMRISEDVLRRLTEKANHNSSVSSHKKNSLVPISVRQQKNISLSSNRNNSRQLSETPTQENEKRISEEILRDVSRLSENANRNGSNNDTNMSKSAIHDNVLSKSTDREETDSLPFDHQREVSVTTDRNGRKISATGARGLQKRISENIEPKNHYTSNVSTGDHDLGIPDNTQRDNETNTLDINCNLSECVSNFEERNHRNSKLKNTRDNESNTSGNTKCNQSKCISNYFNKPNCNYPKCISNSLVSEHQNVPANAQRDNETNTAVNINCFHPKCIANYIDKPNCHHPQCISNSLVHEHKNLSTNAQRDKETSTAEIINCYHPKCIANYIDKPNCHHPQCISNSLVREHQNVPANAQRDNETDTAENINCYHPKCIANYIDKPNCNHPKCISNSLVSDHESRILDKLDSGTNVAAMPMCTDPKCKVHLAVNKKHNDEICISEKLICEDPNCLSVARDHEVRISADTYSTNKIQLAESNNGNHRLETTPEHSAQNYENLDKWISDNIVSSCERCISEKGARNSKDHEIPTLKTAETQNDKRTSETGRNKTRTSAKSNNRGRMSDVVDSDYKKWISDTVVQDYERLLSDTIAQCNRKCAQQTARGYEKRISEILEGKNGKRSPETSVRDSGNRLSSPVPRANAKRISKSGAQDYEKRLSEPLSSSNNMSRLTQTAMDRSKRSSECANRDKCLSEFMTKPPVLKRYMSGRADSNSGYNVSETVPHEPENRSVSMNNLQRTVSTIGTNMAPEDDKVGVNHEDNEIPVSDVRQKAGVPFQLNSIPEMDKESSQSDYNSTKSKINESNFESEKLEPAKLIREKREDIEKRIWDTISNTPEVSGINRNDITHIVNKLAMDLCNLAEDQIEEREKAVIQFVQILSRQVECTGCFMDPKIRYKIITKLLSQSLDIENEIWDVISAIKELSTIPKSDITSMVKNLAGKLRTLNESKSGDDEKQTEILVFLRELAIKTGCHGCVLDPSVRDTFITTLLNHTPTTDELIAVESKVWDALGDLPEILTLPKCQLDCKVKCLARNLASNKHKYAKMVIEIITFLQCINCRTGCKINTKRRDDFCQNLMNILMSQYSTSGSSTESPKINNRNKNLVCSFKCDYGTAKYKEPNNENDEETSRRLDKCLVTFIARLPFEINDTELFKDSVKSGILDWYKYVDISPSSHSDNEKYNGIKYLVFKRLKEVTSTKDAVLALDYIECLISQLKNIQKTRSHPLAVIMSNRMQWANIGMPVDMNEYAGLAGPEESFIKYTDKIVQTDSKSCRRRRSCVSFNESSDHSSKASSQKQDSKTFRRKKKSSSKQRNGNVSSDDESNTKKVKKNTVGKPKKNEDPIQTVADKSRMSSAQHNISKYVIEKKNRLQNGDLQSLPRPGTDALTKDNLELDETPVLGSEDYGLDFISCKQPTCTAQPAHGQKNFIDNMLCASNRRTSPRRPKKQALSLNKSPNNAWYATIGRVVDLGAPYKPTQPRKPLVKTCQGIKIDKNLDLKKQLRFKEKSPSPYIGRPKACVCPDSISRCCHKRCPYPSHLFFQP